MRWPPAISVCDGVRRGGMRLAIVQWNGNIGGAEALSVSLSAALRRAGADPEVVFVADSGQLGERLEQVGVPFRSLGFRRGRDVLLRPGRFAEAVTDAGADGALLPECGYVGTALRIGGYRGGVVATEHGSMLTHKPLGLVRILRHASRAAAARADDVEVAVSDFVLHHMRAGPHARRTIRIHNGVDAETFRPLSGSQARNPSFVIGFTGRLKPGKGVERLIQAFAQVRAQVPGTLLLAGDGPERPHLMSVARSVNVHQHVEFLGWVRDVPAFWNRCDVAVFPTDRLPETFGMAALEAMACGRPVVASDIGALPEVVADGKTGRIVAPGDSTALALALATYGCNEELRLADGAAARQRALDCFRIDDCARAYHDLFVDLARRRPRPRPTAQSSSTLPLPHATTAPSGQSSPRD